MYAILVSFALAVYSVILVDFSLLFQEISVNADLLNSTQALYAAEGEIERTWNQIQTGDLAQRNILMLAAADQSAPQSDEDFLPGGEGLEAFYLNKTLDPAGEDLSAAPAFHPYNRVVQQGVYLADGQALDHLAYYGLEPRSEKTFSFRETSPEGNFNQLVLDYNQGMEAEDMMLDVFAFPKDGLPLELPDFDQLKEGAEGPIRRQTLNTRDETQNGSFLDLGGHLLGVGFGQGDGQHKDRLSLSGFQPLQHNYLLRFQTLGNAPVRFRLSANYQGQPVPLPSMSQTLDAIGATQAGLYQRVKMQRQTEEGLMPGLGFALFSDESIHK